MADKDSGNPDRARRQNSRGEDEVRTVDAPIDLDSEVLAHLYVLCEQFDTHVRAFADNTSQATRQQLVDDLRRIRNDVVVLEKTATEFVINELLSFLDVDAAHRAGDDELKRVLGNAAPQLLQHIRSIQQNLTQDNALALLSTVNDCRASKDEMLLSDVLMLAAGVEMPATHFTSVSDTEWIEQRKQWVEYASTYHATLGQRLLHWWKEGRAGAVAPLRRQLDRFSEACDAHSHLRTLVPLFTAASVVAQAVSDKRLLDGPALRSLFAQLERNVHRCALVASPEDLLPEDLLRNFLYYVAQIETDSEPAATLRRRFRLDRVRLVANATQPSQTSTIGVEYHLINAIRSGITQETKPLRAWLDSPEEHDKQPNVVRLRVRMGQLESVFTLIGARQALSFLKLVVQQLQALGKGDTGSELRATLADALLHMDAELDHRARQSVVRNRQVDTAQVSASDIYIDFATDACLREARSEIQSVADRLMSLLSTQSLDALTCATLVGKLGQVDAALQILPLPEVSPLFDRLSRVVQTLSLQPELFTSATRTTNAVADASDSIPVASLFSSLIVAFDDYLACVLQPEPPAATFLTDAEELLEQLQYKLGMEQDMEGMPHERASDLLSLPDSGSMTLDVEDDVLELALDDEHHTLDTTLQFVFQHECLGHLESLDESIRFALLPVVDGENDVRLPNEKMLRALHTLTGSAQTIGAIDVVSIVQPLQRAALSLHREGRFFDASESRAIGDILKALRLIFEALVNDEPFDGLLQDTKYKLDTLLSQTVTGFNEGALGSAAPLSIGSQITSLEHVFIEEATEVLERLRGVLRNDQPLTEQSVNEAMALLHTLKGSARMAGKPSMSECAHELEAQVQLMGPSEDPLETFKVGYGNLQRQLMHITANLAADSSLRTSDNLNDAIAYPDVAPAGSPVSDALLDYATDLTVSQASVSDELARLRKVCQQVEANMLRWQSASRELKSSVSDKDLSVFVDMMTDMETARSSLRGALRKAEREHQQASRVGANLHQSLVRSRLVRLSDIVSRLADTVEDTASVCGVSVRFELTGGELMLDKGMFRLLVGPLEHLARNAVVHGIEPVEQRVAHDKPSEGLISLTATMDGADLVLRFADDGRGIDKEALNALLQERGKDVIDTDKELQKLLFSAGFSSIGKADAIAGHGLGLSAVEAAVKQLDGDVRLDATMSHGVSITLRIPQRMIISQIVLVKDGERLFGIPVAHVKWVNVESNSHGSSPIKLPQDMQEVSLRRFLGESSGESDHHDLDQAMRTSDAHASGVVLDIHDRLLSIQVEQVIGYREVVAQPLGAQLASLGRFSAGSVLPAGQQVLILDLLSLSASLNNQPRIAAESGNVDYRPMALVVDDSPMTNSTLPTMLIKKGLAVETCEDGPAALASLARQLPSVMILDLDSLGLDGFGIIRRVVKDFALHAPPIIAVSELDDKDRQAKAMKLGAAACLVKPFDQEALHTVLLDAGLRLPDLTIA